MRLFLTGATGFVGLNLLLEALRRGRYAEIVVAVRDAAKLASQLAAEGVPEGDRRIRVVGWGEPQPAEVDHAVHCAGVLFARDRDSYHRVNVDDTLRLLGPLPPSTRVLALSSQSAGGPTPPNCEMRTRSDPDTPITWYGESKREMERRLSAERPGTMIWRPPMILGPRDRATLPLFKMAASTVRVKPGLREKRYSWIAAGDLVDAVFRALDSPDWRPGPPLGACAPGTISDLELVGAAARLSGANGITLRLPHPLLRVAATFVDALPSLRTAVPSLTRDRVKEILPDRWVIDGAEFRDRFGPPVFQSLHRTLEETRDWYVRTGMLP